MISVGELLQNKGNKVWAVGPNSTALEALKLMAEMNIGVVLVMEQEKALGIFSERDYARKVVLKGKSSSTTPISEIMTQDIVYVSPDQRVKDCMALMTAKRIRHLPVREGGKIVGVISIGDLVKQIISEQESTIQELEKYITGSY